MLIVRKGMAYPSGYLDPGRLERCHFFGVVGQQAHGLVAEQSEHSCGDAIKPFVRFEAQPFIRVDRVEALILQAIGAKLVDEADAASFLGEIEQNSATSLREHFNRAAQLRSAV